MKKKIVPTAKEKALADELQTPTEKPQALQSKLGIFDTLLRTPTIDAAQLLGGGKTEWINAMDDVNPLFPTAGAFSVAFFVLRAWYYTSKTAKQPDRMGIKIATPDQKVWHLALSYPFSDETGEPVYADRQAVLEHFEQSTQAVGLMQFQKVDRGQPNPYWRLIYADEHSLELAGEKMPVAPVDPDMPF